MADFNSSDRETLKQRMRRSMWVNKNFEEHENGENEPEEEEGEEKKSLFARLLKKPVFWVAVIFIVLAVSVGVYMKFFKSTLLTEYKEQWTIDMKENNFSEFVIFGTSIVKYDRDGASCYDSSGNLVWTTSFEMSSPVAQVNGDYIVIADQKSTGFYIFGTEGMAGKGSTTLPISKAAVSGQGVAAFILEDTSANYIQFYTKEGEKLDIEIKTVLSGDGYPVDISLSEDGTILAASYVYLSAGAIQSKVVFYNFSESGKNSIQRIVGGFEQYGSALVADVEFLSQKQAVAFADDRISFYSLKNEVSPELVKEVTYSEEIKSVFTGNGLVAVVTGSDSSMLNQKVTVYTGTGSVQCSFDVDMTFTDAAFTGNYIAFTNDNECRIYTQSGSLKYSGALSGSIVKLLSVGGNNWIQVGVQTMKKITLK